MDNKEKLSECLGYLAVALAQYVGEYGLPYACTIDQILSEAIKLRMTDYKRMRKFSKYFTVNYILSMEDPIEFLRLELIDMHKKLSKGE